MTTLTMKFGGASVGTATALTQVLSIVMQEYERWDHLLIVVSALDGVTDALIEAAHLAQLSNRRGYRRIVATLRVRHLSLIEQLPLGTPERNALQSDIDHLLFDMLDACQSIADTPADEMVGATVDKVIGVGERLAARIVAALLRQNNLRGVAIDATDLIVTDEVFGHATPNIALTRQRITQHLLPMLSRRIIPVVTGFIGTTESGQPTTLGRGGSDYTASILAASARSDEVWMWTDVDGMMTTDPHEIPEARLIERLTYDEAAEMAYFGARILHPRMIGPLRERQIPLWVKNVFKPREPGSLIHEAGAPANGKPRAVTMIQGIGLRMGHSGSLAEIMGIIDEIVHTRTGGYADLMITAQSSEHSLICFAVPNSVGPETARAIRAALEKKLEMPEMQVIWSVQSVQIITAIAPHIDDDMQITAATLGALRQIKLLGLSIGPSRCSLSLIVRPQDAERALSQIHEAILNSG